MSRHYLQGQLYRRGDRPTTFAPSKRLKALFLIAVVEADGKFATDKLAGSLSSGSG
jgi:hypothetical protein